MTSPDEWRPATGLMKRAGRRPILWRTSLVLGLALGAVLQPGIALAVSDMGIRDARNECTARGGQFWRTQLGYGCNHPRSGEAFHCQYGRCSAGAMSVPASPREPGNFGGDIMFSGPRSGNH